MPPFQTNDGAAHSAERAVGVSREILLPAPWLGCPVICRGPSGWVARVAADQELDASVDGKWAKQSEDAQGNPLVMVNVLAHGLKLCLAQWPASEKRYEPRVLREQLGRLFELSRPAAADQGRPVCGAGPVPGHSRPRTGLSGAGQASRRCWRR